MQKRPARKRRKVLKKYSINQCALYKIGSINGLSKALGTEREKLDSILGSPLEYKQFVLPEVHNPFSNKTTKARNVQTPYGELRKIHERILYLLEPVELPDYAHASVKNRSYRTNALAHTNSSKIATFDLKNFYGSTKINLVYFFFKDDLRCAPDVAGALTKLTTFQGLMPTGSPLSPLLSLHAAKPMFDRIHDLASSWNLTFTCYCDDLTLSGEVIPRSLERHISNIVKLYGYQLSKNKTKIFDKNKVKHVTGVVINNGKVSVPHTRFLTARNLESAINGEFPNYGFDDIKLHEKLAGLLGETAHIDPSFKEQAKKAQLHLKAARDKSKSKS